LARGRAERVAWACAGISNPKIAKTVGKPDAEIRSLNMYNEGDVTHFGQVSRVALAWR
jgi:hypothetical protein